MDGPYPVEDGWPPPRPGKEADDAWPPPRSEKGVVVEDGGYQGRGKGRELVDREKGEGKKRVRERAKDEDEGVGSLAKDPLLLLGPDILSKVLSHLDAFSVARALLVSRGWQRVSSSDLLWRPMVSVKVL